MPDSPPPGPQDEAIHDALVQSAARRPLGFFFDFDGVLAPIQDEPDRARPVPGVIAQLEQLATLAEKVAIVSARPVEFLAGQFEGRPRLSIFGLYGLETLIDGVTERNQAAASWESAIREVTVAASRELPADVLVEEKPMSVALHYRKQPSHRRAVEDWAQAQAERYGLAQQQGRMVAELKPPLSIDKGTVLAGQIEDLRCAWYFGDDVSDVKGFAALHERQAGDPDFRGVCVAVENTDVVAELEAQADFVLASPLQIQQLLQRAIELIGPAGPGK